MVSFSNTSLNLQKMKFVILNNKFVFDLLIFLFEIVFFGDTYVFIVVFTVIVEHSGSVNAHRPIDNH